MIEAKETYFGELFSDRYLFEIPEFQRQFSWERDNFNQLLDDIKESLLINRGNYEIQQLERYEPYFLGSVILWTKGNTGDVCQQYAIIDGQQRLVSLTILIATLRDLTDNEIRIPVKSTSDSAIYPTTDSGSNRPVPTWSAGCLPERSDAGFFSGRLRTRINQGVSV